MLTIYCNGKGASGRTFALLFPNGRSVLRRDLEVKPWLGGDDGGRRQLRLQRRK